MRTDGPGVGTAVLVGRRLSRRDLLRLASLGAVGVVAAACASERTTRWTFAPVPTAERGESPTPTAPGPVRTPTGSPAGEALIIRIVGENILFDISEFEVPADTPFRIEFENRDAGIPHNVAIYEGGQGGPTLFQGEIFNGVATVTYEVPGLPAGDHFFVCDVHPTQMTGTVRVR